MPNIAFRILGLGSLVCMSVLAACTTETESDEEVFDEGDESAEVVETSTDALSRSDGQASILFKNNCNFSIRLGRTAPNDGRYIASYMNTLGKGATQELKLGPDNRAYPGLGFFAYRLGVGPWGRGTGGKLAGQYSLVEIGLNSGGLDWYNISLVDGYNLPVRIAPEGGDRTFGGCDVLTCRANLNACPAAYQVKKNGQIIACSKFVRGNEPGSVADNPNHPVAKFFAQSCGQAYSWSGEDSKVEACNTQDYRVTFCP